MWNFQGDRIIKQEKAYDGDWYKAIFLEYI